MRGKVGRCHCNGMEWNGTEQKQQVLSRWKVEKTRCAQVGGKERKKGGLLCQNKGLGVKRSINFSITSGVSLYASKLVLGLPEAEIGVEGTMIESGSKWPDRSFLPCHNCMY